MKKKTTKEFIDDAFHIHGDRYIYDKVVYVDAHTNVEIICKRHGSFFQTPSNHLKGGGCSLCNKVEKRRKSLKKLSEDIFRVHGNKYDYSKMNYKNNKTKVSIICPYHGEFKQDMDHHLRGQGCPKCAKNYSDNRDSFIAKAKKVHGDKYDYSLVDYVDSYTKVKIIDPNYGPFLITPNSHLNGRGSWEGRTDKINKTKRKNNTFHSSSNEKEVMGMLIKKFGKDDVIFQYNSEEYPYNCDFYIKSLDLYIELNIYFSHGGHWFDSNSIDDINKLLEWSYKSKKSNLYEKSVYVWTVADLMKRDTAISNGLNYLVFWDYNLNDFKFWYDNFDETNILCNL